MYKILTMILFFMSIQFVSAQKETSIKIHFDANLGLELEREIAPRFSLTLKSEYNVNRLRSNYCKVDSFNINSPFFIISADSIFFSNPIEYDVRTTSIGGRFYPFADNRQIGLYTGLSLNYQSSKRKADGSDKTNQFFFEIPLGYKWRFAKQFLLELGFTTGFIPINNQLCSNHNKLALDGAYFIMLGYQITKNNQDEKESINPSTK